MNQEREAKKRSGILPKHLIMRAGADFPNPELLDRPNLSEGMTFGLCLQGEFRFRIDYREYRISSGELFTVLPRHLFTPLPIPNPDSSDVRFLTVPLDEIHRSPLTPDLDLLRKAEESPTLTPDREKLRQIVMLWELMEQYATPDLRASQIREALIPALLLIITTLIEEQPPQGDEHPVVRQEQLTQRFFDLLLEHHEREHRVAFYADRLCITAKYLSSAVKSVTGYPAQVWINEAVVMQAKRQIRATERSIQQISESLHFATSTSFVRFFRQHTGSTPLEYRKRCLKAE